MNNPIEKALMDAVSFDYPTVPLGFYCVYDINELDDDVENGNVSFPVIGFGDFFFFDLLLLFVMPNISSITTRAWIAFGCIISVQLADLLTCSMLPDDSFKSLPGVPFPTIATTAYAIIVDAIIQYSNLDCEDLFK
jgi:hypothetical protein